MGGGAGGAGQNDPNAELADTSEQIQISSLALLKMLKHGIFLTKLEPEFQWK
jgi:hypothetical protein